MPPEVRPPRLKENRRNRALSFNSGIALRKSKHIAIQRRSKTFCPSQQARELPQLHRRGRSTIADGLSKEAASVWRPLSVKALQCRSDMNDGVAAARGAVPHGAIPPPPQQDLSELQNQRQRLPLPSTHSQGRARWPAPFGILASLTFAWVLHPGSGTPDVPRGIKP